MPHRYSNAGIRKVVSSSGDIVLENILGVFEYREAPYAYVVEWKGEKIGFEVPWYRLPNDDRGRRQLVLKISKFGETNEVTLKLGLRPAVFASSQERAEALVDTAEALLTLSNAHKKGTTPEGYCVVEVENRIVRMEDFDIVEQDLGVD